MFLICNMCEIRLFLNNSSNFMYVINLFFNFSISVSVWFFATTFLCLTIWHKKHVLQQFERYQCIRYVVEKRRLLFTAHFPHSMQIEINQFENRKNTASINTFAGYYLLFIVAWHIHEYFCVWSDLNWKSRTR